ncbi:MAG TPA: hypothetical protein VGI39_39755 [Polyangiaceae bacterium]|jgi:hypothetical protein
MTHHPLPLLASPSPSLACRHTPGCRGAGDHVCTVEAPPAHPRTRARRLRTLGPDSLRYYQRGLGLVDPAVPAPPSLQRTG